MQNIQIQHSSIIGCETSGPRKANPLWHTILRFVERVHRRRHLRTLQKLSNAELSDIGLRRGDLYESAALGLNQDVTCHLSSIAKSRRTAIYRSGTVEPN